MIRQSIEALKGVLASKHVLWLVPAITAGLLAFGLDAGWMVDDYVHRAAPELRHVQLMELNKVLETAAQSSGT